MDWTQRLEPEALLEYDQSCDSVLKPDCKCGGGFDKKHCNLLCNKWDECHNSWSDPSTIDTWSNETVDLYTHACQLAYDQKMAEEMSGWPKAAQKYTCPAMKARIDMLEAGQDN